MIFKFINKIDVFDKNRPHYTSKNALRVPNVATPDIPHWFDISPHPNTHTRWNNPSAGTEPLRNTRLCTKTNAHPPRKSSAPF